MVRSFVCSFVRSFVRPSVRPYVHTYVRTLSCVFFFCKHRYQCRIAVTWIERGTLNATESLRAQLRLQEDKGGGVYFVSVNEAVEINTLVKIRAGIR